MEADKKEQKYKLIAPDGGWGYAIAFGKILTFTLASGQALFSNILTQKFSKRSVGVTAAIAYCLGSFCQIFANSTLPLFIGSAVHGAALGLMLPIIFASFNEYFVQRHACITGISQLILGLGKVGAPLGVQYILEEYGFRGCLVILTAINFHSIVGMMVIQPVEWHMKKVPIDNEANEDNVKEEDSQQTNGKVEESQQLQPLVVEHKGNAHMKSALSLRHLKISSAMDSRRSSSTSIADCAGSLIITEALEPILKTGGIRYVLILVGVSRIIAVSTAADLVSSCMIAGVTAIIDIPPRLTYLIALILTIISRYALFFVNDFWGMVVFTSVTGFPQPWVHVPVGLIFADYLPSEKFSSGYGLFMFLHEMFTLAIGPFIRYVRDVTESYKSVFHVLNIFLIINVITWSLQYIWDSFRRKRVSNQQRISINKASHAES